MSVVEFEQVQLIKNSIIDNAWRNGHYEIVQLLIQLNPCQSVENIDDFSALKKMTADNKTRTDKFVCYSNQIAWMKVDENISQQAEKWRWLVKNSWEEKKLDWLINEIQIDFIERELKDSKDYQEIEKYFQQAKQELNPLYLIRAYTAETDFYKHLNKQLAIIGGNFKSTNNQTNRCGIKCYLQILFTHPCFHRMSYTGQCYRGMAVTKHDLNQYRQGSQIMNKAFLSTSTDYFVAEQFAIRCVQKNQQQHYAVLCTYQISTPRLALNIEETSIYKQEKEVLIMPYTTFRIKSIRRNHYPISNQEKQLDFYIDLEEKLQYDQNQTIRNTKSHGRFQKFMKKLNKWLGNNDKFE